MWDRVVQVAIRFGTRVDDLLVKDKHVVGVKVSDSRENRSPSTSQQLGYDAMVLAVGHSAAPPNKALDVFPGKDNNREAYWGGFTNWYAGDLTTAGKLIYYICGEN
ncbi:hypothetical protein CQW23_34772 [Capsicum baccatum]|uniref:FAD/NAD(P)-binding domain-containing protein n=1 Tax=Capsicum baccatum TaxID=33114 RepID=A0A2G2UXZ8_CAPBA|nr:hypothetical protein CQW23_34772 [Capsicum baccatum]